MRLIDADKLLDWYDRQGWDGVQAVVDMQPTIDAVPVVRCKDCIHGEPSCSIGGWIFCNETGQHNEKYYYCASGERENGTNKSDER